MNHCVLLISLIILFSFSSILITFIFILESIISFIIIVAFDGVLDQLMLFSIANVFKHLSSIFTNYLFIILTLQSFQVILLLESFFPFIFICFETFYVTFI
jgi:hypothetical protein